MNCREFDEHMIDFLFGEMQPAESRQVRLHLEGCTKCANRLDESRAVIDIVSKDEEEPSPWVGQRIMAMAREPRESRWAVFWRSLSFRPAAVIPAFVAVCALGAVSYTMYNTWFEGEGTVQKVAHRALPDKAPGEHLQKRGPMPVRTGSVNAPRPEARPVSTAAAPSSRKSSGPAEESTYDVYSELKSETFELAKEAGAWNPPARESEDRKATSDPAYEAFERGNRLLDKSLYSQAVQHYGTVLSQKPESRWAAYAMHGLALSYHAMGRCREALDTIEKLQSDHPYYPRITESNLLAIQLLEELGEHDEAEAKLRYCMDQFPECGMLVTGNLTILDRSVPRLIEVSTAGGSR